MGPPPAGGPRLPLGRRRSMAPPWTATAAPRVGDGVIGSPPAFGAVQSRFESESPSAQRAVRLRRSVIAQESAAVEAPARSPEVAAVVVLAAGQGTRMRSATPKGLHTLGGRSLLGHVLAGAEPRGRRGSPGARGGGGGAAERGGHGRRRGGRPPTRRGTSGAGGAGRG